MRALSISLLLLTLLGVARADERPIRDLGSAEAAAAFVKASPDDDAGALEVAQRAFDVWRVALELSRGGHGELLPAWVDQVEVAGRAGTLREHLSALQALAAEATAKALDALTEADRLCGAGKAREAVALLDSLGEEQVLPVAFRVRARRAYAAMVLGDLDEGEAGVVAVAEEAAAVGDHAIAARVLDWAGLFWYQRGRIDRSYAMWARSMAAYERGGPCEAAFLVMANAGYLAGHMGKPDEALDLGQKALALAEAMDSARYQAQAHLGLAQNYIGTYQPDLGREHAERAVSLSQAEKDLRTERLALGVLARAAELQGDISGATRWAEEALDRARGQGDPIGIGLALNNLAWMQRQGGRTAEAIETTHAAIEILRGAGDERGVALAQGNLGAFYLNLGDATRAQRHLKACVGTLRRLGAVRSAVNNLVALADAHHLAKEMPEAEAIYREALEIARKTGSVRIAIEASAGLAYIAIDAKRLEEARTHLVRARDTALEHGVEPMVIYHSVRLADVLRGLGRLDEAAPMMVDAIQRARDANHARYLSLGLWAQAQLLLQQERTDEALAVAEEALALTRKELAALGSEEGAKARSFEAGSFLTGVGIGLASGRPEAAFYFIEAARAGSLLMALDARGKLRDASVDPGLRVRERAAAERERAAQEQLRVARAASRRRAVKRASKLLREARRTRQTIAEAIERNARLTLRLAYPEPAAMKDVQSLLAPDTAMVLYAATGAELHALVLRSTEARIVRLGTLQALAAPMEGLDLSDAASDPDKAIPDLQLLLAKPLGLDADVTRVLVSPVGELAYLPFALIFPSREVAHIPSASTYRLLRTEPRLPTSDEVIALGDPDYGTHSASQAAARAGGQRSGRLEPLPATRPEVNAIGHTVLLGDEATETRLWAALRRDDERRWRALHLACHGLLDAERPLNSSLALTADNRSDGFLTALEISGQQVPADLVVSTLR